MARVSALILLGWCLSVGLPGRAQEPTPPRTKPSAALHWVRLKGAEDCIRGETLAGAVEARLQRELFFDPRSPAMVIEGHAARSDGVYRASLRVSASDGTLLGARELSSRASDCRELSETVAIVLAIMIDPEAESASAPPQAPPAEPIRASTAELRHQLLTFARGGYRLLPGITYGVGAAYQYELRSWGEVRAEGVGFFERRRALDLDSQPFATHVAGASFRLSYGGLAYCPPGLGQARVHAAGCLGGELGVLRGKGFGFDPDGERRTAWASASVATRLSFQLVGPLRAHLGASLLVPIIRSRYQASVGDGQAIEVYRPPAFGGTLDLGVGAQFAL